MRLDKLLTELNTGTRSQVKVYLKQGLVTVNGTVITKPEYQTDPEKDCVTFQGRTLSYRKYEYYMLNKPQDVLSATRDRNASTVLDLLPADHKKDTFPAGRLDKDTEGLLILTNDGELSHQLLSPRKHVSKTYLAGIAAPLSEEDILKLETGIDLGEEDGITQPASVTVLPEQDAVSGKIPCRHWIHLTIHEGKFHQVKRMLQAVNNEVLYLKRIRFGGLSLDPSLSPGQVRELTVAETEILRNAALMEKRKKELISEKKAVIFDLDGTLIDSMWLWEDIDREYLAQHGLNLDEYPDLQKQIEGMSFFQTAQYFQKHFHITQNLQEMMEQWNQMAWDKYAHEVPLKPGVLNFLQSCRRHGIKLGIATSNSRELVENILKVHHLEDYFSCILTGSEVTNGKPAPDIYLAVAEKLHVNASECLVFEDIIPGLMAGRNAGMTICAVEDAYSAETRTQKKEFADYYIEDYYDFF